MTIGDGGSGSGSGSGKEMVFFFFLIVLVGTYFETMDQLHFFFNLFQERINSSLYKNFGEYGQKCYIS